MEMATVMSESRGSSVSVGRPEFAASLIGSLNCTYWILPSWWLDSFYELFLVWFRLWSVLICDWWMVDGCLIYFISQTSAACCVFYLCGCKFEIKWAADIMNISSNILIISVNIMNRLSTALTVLFFKFWVVVHDEKSPLSIAVSRSSLTT